METTTFKYPRKEEQTHQNVVQPQWQRILLLSVLGFEAAGCLLGGSLLVAAPDGSYMDMPVDIMHGVFSDFLIPGILLLGLGIINAVAFFAVFRKKPSDWIMAGVALGGLLFWFWIEIAILLEFHWLHAIWGLPVVAGFLSIFSLVPSRQKTLRRAALYCGILSSLLFTAINIIVPMHYPGYDCASQVPSELSAIGAPTRMLWSVLAFPYTFLMLAFAWGIWKSAGENRALRITGILLLAYGALGFLWPFAPMHQRELLAEGGGTFSDTMHIALGAVTNILYLAALGFAATAVGKRFRMYSIATFVVLLFFGILTFMDAPKLSTNEPTPMIGLWERINIGVFLLWVVVLAIVLLRAEKKYGGLNGSL